MMFKKRLKTFDELKATLVAAYKDDQAVCFSLNILSITALAFGVLKGRHDALNVSERIDGAINKSVAERQRHSIQEAARKRRRQGDQVREAAKRDISLNPATGQSECARRVAALTGKSERHVNRMISSMFEPRPRVGKRPKAIFRNARP